jgi:hypothetical protein
MAFGPEWGTLQRPLCAQNIVLWNLFSSLFGSLFGFTSSLFSYFFLFPCPTLFLLCFFELASIVAESLIPAGC